MKSIIRTAGDSLFTRYLCDTYDKQHRLLPPVGDKKRYEVLYWMHAAEAMWALHGIAILYVRWHQKDGTVAKTEEGLSKNVVNGMFSREPSYRFPHILTPSLHCGC